MGHKYPTCCVQRCHARATGMVENLTMLGTVSQWVCNKHKTNGSHFVPLKQTAWYMRHCHWSKFIRQQLDKRMAKFDFDCERERNKRERQHVLDTARYAK